MNLLIAGGGTGGHLYPGVAVAEELLNRTGGHVVSFAGSDRGIEARVLGALGLPFTPIRAGGVVGAGAAGKLKAMGKLFGGFADARALKKKFRPDACLGVGGYVSFPVAAWCATTGVPTAIQEQNAAPGLANRVLSRLVRRIYVGDEAAMSRFPAGKARFTGNPLRRVFAAPFPYEPPAPGERLRILVLGGSQGAKSLNETVPAALAALESRGIAAEVRHQSGRGREEATRAAYGERQGVSVEPFIEDMASAYRFAQIVIARAGALTLAELAAAGRPAILVPFPFAAGNHQEANARAAEARGAARMITERDLDAERLASMIAAWAAEPALPARMAEAAAASARIRAAQVIVDDLLALAGERS